MATSSNLHERTKSKVDAGAGANLSTAADHGKRSRKSSNNGLYEKFLMFSLFALVISESIGINTVQFMVSPLYFFDKGRYYTYMAVTKKYFGILLNTITKTFSPTVVRVSGDADVVADITVTNGGRLETRFPKRLVLIANHIIYTDWLYMWWVAYTSHMHGHIFIILKESLKYVPVIGPGMMFYGFIFMARNWAKDQARLFHRLSKLSTDTNDPATGDKLNPMWLLIFPEGTNMSDNGRIASKRWADKQGVEDLKHCLLPRSTGMQFCLEKLDSTVEWVYDCTVQYEGIPPGEYGQDVYSLRSIYFQGNVPTSVNIYWRRYATKDIPIGDKDKFNEWITARWREKDILLEQYAQTGRFPANSQLQNGETKKPQYFETTVQHRTQLEPLLLAVPIAVGAVWSYIVLKVSFALVLRLVHSLL